LVNFDKSTIFFQTKSKNSKLTKTLAFRSK
jgi:hypothetical protein